MAQKEVQESESCRYWEQDKNLGFGTKTLQGIQVTHTRYLVTSNALSNKNRSGYMSSENPTNETKD